MLILLIALSSCSYKSTEERFDELKSPVVVVSKGTVVGDCRTVFVDADGVILTLNDNGFCSVRVGDTIK